MSAKRPRRREAAPLPEPDWMREARDVGETLAAIGLRRPLGFLAGDTELLCWLFRRIAAAKGADAARDVFLLTEMPAPWLPADLRLMFWPDAAELGAAG